MICNYYDPKTNTYNLMQQLQDMADARARNPDRKPPKMYYNYAQQKCYEVAEVIPPLKVILGKTPMKEWIGKLNQHYIDAEIKKAYSDARYFYLKYWQIDGKPTHFISQESWDARVADANKILIKYRRR